MVIVGGSIRMGFLRESCVLDCRHILGGGGGLED